MKTVITPYVPSIAPGSNPLGCNGMYALWPAYYPGNLHNKLSLHKSPPVHFAFAILQPCEAKSQSSIPGLPS